MATPIFLGHFPQNCYFCSNIFRIKDVARTRVAGCSMYGKWFGFEKEEVFEEGLASFEIGDFELAAEAFEACRRDDPTEERYRTLLLKCKDEITLRSAAFEGISDQAPSAVQTAPLFALPDLSAIADVLKRAQRIAFTPIHIRPVSLFHH